MTPEEKAKAYDKAIKMTKDALNDGTISSNPIAHLQNIFPELKESDDEGIRKKLISYFSAVKGFSTLEYNYGITNEEAVDWLKKQGKQDGQKLIDKDKQKFNVGDWVVTSYGKVNQVIAVDKDGDEFTLDDGTDFSGSWKDCYHLWTIQDAKNGDVLAAKDTVFIFNHLDKTGLSLCKSYCEVIGNSKLGFGFEFSINSVYPATKEQREHLEKAMADAGYTFDFGKKELKKIEDEPENCKKQVMSEMTDLVKDYIRQKPAGSKEDEYLLNETITHLEELIRITKKMGSAYSDEIQYYQRDIDWLKSLKDRYAWKPSKEQLRELENVFSPNTDSWDEDILRKLYEQLKQL